MDKQKDIKDFFNKYNDMNSLEMKKNNIESFVKKFKVQESNQYNFESIKNIVESESNSNQVLDLIETMLDIRSDLDDYLTTKTITENSKISEEILSFENYLYDIIKTNLKIEDLICKSIKPDEIDPEVLEDIIANEAVHPYKDRSEIKQRINGSDRLCLVLFHKDLPKLPLMSLYIALTDGIPDRMSLISVPSSSPTLNPNSAIFYSISSLHKGLKNVNFGHILIKKALTYLQETYSNKIKHFCTLSPIPNFKNHLKRKSDLKIKSLLNLENDNRILESNKDIIFNLCLDYIYNEKKKGNKVIDPVCNFHLKNGASIYRLNWNGDNSKHRFDESFGIMINYYYNPEKLSNNSIQYKNDGTININEIFQNQLRNKL